MIMTAKTSISQYVKLNAESPCYIYAFQTGNESEKCGTLLTWTRFIDGSSQSNRPNF